jgi:hypothetical protein
MSLVLNIKSVSTEIFEFIATGHEAYLTAFFNGVKPEPSKGLFGSIFGKNKGIKTPNDWPSVPVEDGICRDGSPQYFDFLIDRGEETDMPLSLMKISITGDRNGFVFGNSESFGTSEEQSKMLHRHLAEISNEEIASRIREFSNIEQWNLSDEEIEDSLEEFERFRSYLQDTVSENKALLWS